MSELKALIERFENRAPEIVFEWSDRETEAKGWVVINSLRGGAAGGGTRMRQGLDRREVESLAKTMEVKFTVSGPAIGGAKSGINFDPNDPRKVDVLRRWYKAVIPLLKNYYGTGGDMNVDEIEEVIPITEEYGLWHPQEGIVKGHFQPSERELINKIGQLRQGVSKVIEDPAFTPLLSKRYTMADMITGYGVSESVRHYYEQWGGSLAGKKVIIQGWGNVGAAAGFYLAKAGARIVGIIDRYAGIIRAEGYTTQEVQDLMLKREDRRLTSADLLSFEETNARIWDVAADIFVPAAGSRLVTADQVSRMAKAGVKVISCGANVPFNDPEIFYGATFEQADRQMAVIPDFVANCGMARVFAYLMQQHVEVSDKAIFGDTSQIIGQALQRIHAENPAHTGIGKTALTLSLRQLV